MESLHAPWRIEYILSPKPKLDASLFTRIAQSADDMGNLVVVRDRSCYALLNRYPYTVGHMMAVPYRKVADIAELTDGERLELWDQAAHAQKLLREVVRAEGFNVGLNLGKAAGAGVADHLLRARVGLQSILPRKSIAADVAWCATGYDPGVGNERVGPKVIVCARAASDHDRPIVWVGHDAHAQG